MKLLKFISKKKFLFEIHGMYIPGNVVVDFVIIRAGDLETAKGIVKSILRHKRKLSSKKEYYEIVSITNLDDITANITRITGVLYNIGKNGGCILW